MARLLFLGDVYLPHPVELRTDLPGHLVYNLEAPLTTAQRGWPNTVNLKCETDHTVATFGRRPAAVCLANNHIMDYGAEGLAETVRRLDEAGTPHFGAGSTADDCRNPLLLTLDGRTIALTGYVCPSAHPVFASAERPGVAPIDLARIADDMARARAAGAERVIVCLHWGIEEVELPRPEDVTLARSIIDLGADLVIGHHAHCVQPFEEYRGRHIFYGLGNAIFPDVDVPSEFGEDGVPRVRYVKRQNYWNRPSLAVEYDATTGAVAMRLLHCDGRVLSGRSGDPARLRLDAGALPEYERRFERHHFYATWRKKLVNYARDPKLPRARHLRSLIAILREARGSAA